MGRFMTQPRSKAAASGRTAGLGTARPTRKPRDPQLDRAVYAMARLAILCFRALPAGWAPTVGRALGRLGWRVSRRYRNQVLRHMDIAFRDEYPRAQKEAWCLKYFEHTGLSLVEFARMGAITQETVDSVADLSELKAVDTLLAQGHGKGVLFVPAHHGNWELSGHLVGLKGLPIQSVARPLDNPLLDEMVREMREQGGNRIIEKWNVLWYLKKLLDQGHLVTMSIDQNGGVAGCFIPVFGTPASTVTSPADLQLATKIPLVVGTLNRQADGIRHRFHLWDVIPFERTGTVEEDKVRILARIHRAYEKAIRAYPEQWLWVHKRWKTRPPGEEPGPDGLPPTVHAKSE
ncbi:MAG: hypothetical protein AMXMBFR7_43990 [Planctomycetota bacterium]